MQAMDFTLIACPVLKLVTYINAENHLVVNELTREQGIWKTDKEGQSPKCWGRNIA